MNEAMASLRDLDPRYPVPLVSEFLSRSENYVFLNYVYKDPFGCHVFPGDIENYPLASFFSDMESEITKAQQIHLWAYIPSCRYRCHFCQFPTVILNPHSASSQAVLKELVDLNIKEATLWLAKVPSLADVEVGEFNIFGGTPSLLPESELRRLMAFYKANFNLSTTTMRFEGEPGTLTKSYLSLLRELGFTKVSFGAQSFDDRIISACGRMHSANDCVEAVYNARELGIDWVSVDLIYGMLGQSVDAVRYDMEKTRELELSHVVCTKLHLEEFMKTRTGISGERRSVWQRTGLDHVDSMCFPGLGKQYQMRELIEEYLGSAYREHPTMYFYRHDHRPEKWKSLVTDLDKQFPEVAVGLGGSSKCTKAEAINITGYRAYRDALREDRLPIQDSRGMSPVHREISAFKMALSTLIPVDDAVFRQRFGRSFFDNEIINCTLRELIEKSLVVIERDVVTLTPNGVTLVEAIINTQFAPSLF
ncbi:MULTISPECIES: radical SAM protein [unclassified Sinorhizobium]|uniref:radical SAM protein n=1 Tax=unclassified Sinorhizobium TaxID=2613772 RepID=UPI0024C3E254|nr:MULTISPECIES: radical SAM protein [unclassified Sinorhizobium]MDK1378114.1 radical SAM protein [Sinorhizobium sp. 6-70]MDK1481737.1 radical SAM protein [Sinorhizobium sp. 6-117]